MELETLSLHDPVTERMIEDRTEEINDAIEERILTEIGADTTVSWKIFVHRVMNADGSKAMNEPRLMELDPAQLNDASLLIRLKPYGSGTYRVRTYKAGKIKFQNDIAIETEPAKPQEAIRQTEMGSLIEMLSKRMDRQDQMLREFMMQSGRPSGDTLQSITLMKEMFALQRELNPPRQETNSLDSLDKLLSVIAKVRDNVGEAAPSEGGLLGFLTSFVKSDMAAKLMESVAAGIPQPPQMQQRNDRQLVPPRPPNRQGNVRVEQHGAKVEARTQSRPQEQPRTEAAQPSNNPDGPSASPSNANGKDNIIMGTMQSHPQAAVILERNIQYLLTRAENDSDPELYAEWFLDNMPDEVESELVPLLHDASLIDNIGKAIPKVLEYKEWFEQCRLKMVELLNDNEGEEMDDNAGGSQSDTGRGGGDTGDTE